MQNLYIVYGRPGWSSKFLIASVNACGKYEAMDFKIKSLGKIKDVEYTDYKWDDKVKRKVASIVKYPKELENFECIAFTKELRSGKILESPPVTIELAIQEGWYQKDGSKWRTMTKLMLMYRAASFWTNTHAPELSMGIRTAEENEDFIPYEEVSAKVETEISGNANKVPMGFDEPQPGKDKPAEQVKTDTPGEQSGSNGSANAASNSSENGQTQMSGPGF